MLAISFLFFAISFLLNNLFLINIMNADYENFVHDTISQIISQDAFQLAESDEESIVEIARSNEVQKSISFFFWELLSIKSFRRIVKSSFNTLILTRDDNFVIFILKTKLNFQKWFVENTSWRQNSETKLTKHNMFVWDSRIKKKDFWIEWHETMKKYSERFHVLCKNCDFRILHSISENIENNIMSRHRSNFQCRRAKQKESAIQQNLLKDTFHIVWCFYS